MCDLCTPSPSHTHTHTRSTLHFYNLKAGLAQPQMLVVTEIDEPFVPLPDDLLVNLAESRGVVEALLDALPGNFANNASVDSAMGPALQVGGVGGFKQAGRSGVLRC